MLVVGVGAVLLLWGKNFAAVLYWEWFGQKIVLVRRSGEARLRRLSGRGTQDWGSWKRAPLIQPSVDCGRIDPPLSFCEHDHLY